MSTVFRTHRFRLKDKKSRKKVLNQHAIAVNQVWNWCNGYQKWIESNYRSGMVPKKWPNHFDLTKEMKGVGKLLGINQQMVQVICQQYVVSRTKNHHSTRFRKSLGSKRSLGWIPFQKQSYQTKDNSKNCRKDYIEKATTKVAKENGTIYIGNLKLKALGKTKSSMDSGAGMFRRKLGEKASRHQAHFVIINEAFTTVTCSSCGARSGPKGQKELRIRQWTCVGCGVDHDRDVNSAINHVIVGRRTTPPVEGSRVIVDPMEYCGEDNRIDSNHLTMPLIAIVLLCF